MKKHFYFLLFILSGINGYSQPQLTIDVSKKGINISPTHYGIFFEDINHAADGGLYAELIRNRSFEDASTPENWTLLTQGSAVASISLDSEVLLNLSHKQALKLSAVTATATARAAVYNTGFWGINAVKGRTYKLSFFAKSNEAFAGKVTASLESAGGMKYAQASMEGVNTGWQKFTCTLTSNGNDANARLVLAVNSVGVVWFDVVSLFPPTFNDRENGLRPELAQLLANLKPKFVRFPGGCFVEGDVLANRFQWKKTIGKIEERPGHNNLWGYRTSDGMGYHEFLQLSEDLNAEPLYVVNVGVAHNDFQPYSNLDAYIQDALDALEYANGDVSTTFGAKRAANGHPEPFNLKYLEVGNENYHNDNYGNRYLKFYNAIKTKYPYMQIIGDVAAWGTDNPTWTFSHPVDLLDEHYYRNPQWFINQYNKYDTYNRNGAKIYVGEYAVTSECGLGNLSAAIGEAVYMAGMEKNSDIVPLNSYAPIFVNVNDRKWNPDMICYNASSVYCTPSYYVQKLFANNIGTVDIPIQDSLNIKTQSVKGAIGLGTWATQAEYSNIQVKNEAGNTIFSDQFASASNWTPGAGSWSVSGGVYTQSSSATDCRSIATSFNDSVYTYTLKAKRKGGNEGFLIIFGHQDSNNFYWWNIGGWGNTQHAVEHCIGGTKTVVSTVAGSISTNVLYDVKIEVTKTKVLCYLNNTLIQSFSIPASYQLYTAASLDETSKQLFIKVINPSATDITSTINIAGVQQGEIQGEQTVLTSGSKNDENSLNAPNLVTPVTTSFNTTSNNFGKTFKANSVTVLKMDLSNFLEVQTLNQNSETLSFKPNPTEKKITINNGSDAEFLLEIQSLSGKTVMLQNVRNEQEIDISNLEKGIYILKTQLNNRSQTGKLIVK
ncbi:MAG TPA: alpha-L-arabinofuranosidase C-terminal domain-containing protein [Paludibacter sp.]|nr:alpha-L-arabinofuranosidase C-terminal domain-containing protein [Paludibacter sp.]